MSVDDLDIRGVDDDKAQEKDVSLDDSEQDVIVPDFSEQEIIALTNLDVIMPEKKGGSIDNSPTETNLKAKYQSGRRRDRQQYYNQHHEEDWYHARHNGSHASHSRYESGMDYGHSAIRYLMSIGIPRHQLTNLPKNILRLIDPTRCGICNSQLESYHASRAHYLSKGHNKKLNNFQFRRTGTEYPYSEKQISLRPRNEYCELCNVEITSKVHADSHYAGKPHRAIVERRKQPKNLALLQKGMKDRLDMLIKREREKLANLPVVKQPIETSKPCQPELYCEICKTSVTCSDQMINHLNGKRHLSKEKQHILQMMKGEICDNSKQNAENADKDCNEENEEDIDDWGSGGGTWDDDPQ